MGCVDCAGSMSFNCRKCLNLLCGECEADNASKTRTSANSTRLLSALSLPLGGTCVFKKQWKSWKFKWNVKKMNIEFFYTICVTYLYPTDLVHPLYVYM